MATTASPPGRFSTTTGCFHFAVSRSASSRAPMSAPLPGPSDTMKRTGRCGQVWACAQDARETVTSEAGRERAERLAKSMHNHPPSIRFCRCRVAWPSAPRKARSAAGLRRSYDGQGQPDKLTNARPTAALPGTATSTSDQPTRSIVPCASTPTRISSRRNSSTSCMEVAGDYKDMGKRVRSLPALYDLDFRKKIVDGHKDYQQILSYPQPPIESSAKTPQQHRRDHPDHQRRLRRAVRARRKTISRAGWRRFRSARRTPASPKRSARSRTARSACRSTPTSPASRSTCPEYRAVLEEDERARQADLAASGARRRDAGLSAAREEVAVRDLVDARLVVRDRLHHDAARLLQDHGQPSQPEDHHPPLRRHRADARRPARPGQRRDGLAHHRRGLRRRCARASRSARSTISRTTSGPTPRCSAACRRPSAAWSSSRSRRSCSPPTARSIRKAARCIRARRCEILDSLNIPKADREAIDYRNLEKVTGVKLVK